MAMETKAAGAMYSHPVIAKAYCLFSDGELPERGDLIGTE